LTTVSTGTRKRAKKIGLISEGDHAMTESATIALWGLAEQFVASDPGKSIICLQAALQESLPYVWEAKTRVRLAELLLAHTLNVEDAKDHLNRAVRRLFRI
jgi:MAternally-affected-uncoordination protein